MIKAVSVQNNDGETKQYSAEVNLQTGEVVTEGNISVDCEVIIKGSSYKAAPKNGSLYISMEDVREIIFEIQ